MGGRGVPRAAYRGPVSAPAAARAAALDAAAVLVFVVVGRRNHEEGTALAGVVGTAWPFLVALALGWVAARAWRAPGAARTGVVVWAVTTALGLLLRAVAGGAAPPASFAVVTAVVLGVLLLGWRQVAAAVHRRAHRRRRVPAA